MTLTILSRYRAIKNLRATLRLCGYDEATIKGVCAAARYLDAFMFDGEFYDLRRGC